MGTGGSGEGESAPAKRGNAGSILPRRWGVSYGTEGDVPTEVKGRMALGRNYALVPQFIDAQTLSHLLVQKPLTGAIGLDPFTVDHELGNGALAGAGDNFLGGAGRGFDVNLCIGIL
jgi:hypothetical protein